MVGTQRGQGEGSRLPLLLRARGVTAASSGVSATCAPVPVVPLCPPPVPSAVPCHVLARCQCPSLAQHPDGDSLPFPASRAASPPSRQGRQAGAGWVCWLETPRGAAGPKTMLAPGQLCMEGLGTDGNGNWEVSDSRAVGMACFDRQLVPGVWWRSVPSPAPSGAQLSCHRVLALLKLP